MGCVNVNRILMKQLWEINELRNKCDNLTNTKITVSKDVYDRAEKMAKELNTDVEGIFAFAAYRLIARDNIFSPLKRLEP